jgi:hypothetical protein
MWEGWCVVAITGMAYFCNFLENICRSWFYSDGKASWSCSDDGIFTDVSNVTIQDAAAKTAESRPALCQECKLEARERKQQQLA